MSCRNKCYKSKSVKQTLYSRVIFITYFKVLFPFILVKIRTFQQVSVSWKEEFNQRQIYHCIQQISLVYVTEREKKLTQILCLRSLQKY